MTAPETSASTHTKTAGSGSVQRACSAHLCDLLKAVREIQRDAKVYGLMGETNHPAVRCEVKGLTLGHWYRLEEAMNNLIGPNDPKISDGGGLA